jgi:uncharacterized membrane protein
MTDNPKPVPSGNSGPEAARSTDMLLVAYICYLISIIFGITALLGLVISYLKRGEETVSWRISHYTWLIRTFWIGLLYGVIGTVLTGIGIGVLILFATVIWFIIRIVKGWMRYAKEEPVANVESWFIG